MRFNRFWAWSGFWLASLFYLYEFCLQVSPTVMTDVLMSNYHTTAAGIGMISGFYFYAYTLMQIPVGILYDRFSARYLLGWANMICALGAFVFLTSHSISMACVARFLMGLGSAFAFVAVIIFVNRWFKPIYFATLVGVAQLMSSVGAIAAETPLSMAVTQFGWQETMVAIAWFGVCLGILTWLFARDGEKEDQHANVSSWAEEKAKLKQLLRDPQTLAIGFYTFCVWVPMTAFAGLWGVPFIREVYHVSDLVASGYCIAIWVAVGLASPLVGMISDYYKNRKTVLWVLALIGFVGSTLVIIFPYSNGLFIIMNLSLIGVAAGGQSLSFAVVNDNHGNDIVGTASGINNMFTVSGGAIFQPLIGYLLKVQGGEHIINNIPVYSAGSYQVAMSVVPLSLLGALLISLFFLRESYHNE